MPVGPQHRSGGGGLRSGGSRSGRFGGHRSSFGGRRTVFIFGGGGYNGGVGETSSVTDPELLESYKKKSTATTLLVVGIFSLFIALMLFFSFSSQVNKYQTNIKIMDDDAIFYQNLLEDSNATHAEAQVKWERYYMTMDGVDYYYIEYYIFNSNTDIDGETYAQYTLAEVRAIGDTIDIVYDTDGFSMNADWKKENAEYLYNKSQLNTNKNLSTVFTVISIILAVLVVLAIVNCVKVYKRENEKIKRKQAQIATETEEKEDVIKNGKKCAYCGSRVQDGKTKCPNCGASVK